MKETMSALSYRRPGKLLRQLTADETALLVRWGSTFIPEPEVNRLRW